MTGSRHLKMCAPLLHFWGPAGFWVRWSLSLAQPQPHLCCPTKPVSSRGVRQPGLNVQRRASPPKDVFCPRGHQRERSPTGCLVP